MTLLTGADFAHVGGVGPEVVHRVLARQLHQGLAVAALPEPADPGVEAALSPVELVLLRARLADAPRVHLGRLGLDVGVVEAAEHDAEVQHGEPSEERSRSIRDNQLLRHF